MKRYLQSYHALSPSRSPLSHQHKGTSKSKLSSRNKHFRLLISDSLFLEQPHTPVNTNDFLMAYHDKDTPFTPDFDQFGSMDDRLISISADDGTIELCLDDSSYTDDDCAMPQTQN